MKLISTSFILFLQNKPIQTWDNHSGYLEIQIGIIFQVVKLQHFIIIIILYNTRLLTVPKNRISYDLNSKKISIKGIITIRLIADLNSNWYYFWPFTIGMLRNFKLFIGLRFYQNYITIILSPNIFYKIFNLSAELSS